MGDGTAISWASATWNPLAGCSHCSPGCDGCYAARDSFGRLRHSPYYGGLAERRTPDELPRFTGELRFFPERLDQPLRWKRPRHIFVNSQSDLFHADVPEDFIVSVFDTIVQASQHIFQVLTKRPQRMARLMDERVATPAEVDAGCEFGLVPGVWDRVSSGIPARNCWLGTSIENDNYSFRADWVRRTPSALRWLSLEPLIGPLPSLNLEGIDWVVVGGESGPRSRPLQETWVRDLRDRCAERNIPFHLKQMGAVWASEHGVKGKASHPEEWPEDLRLQQMPDAA